MLYRSPLVLSYDAAHFSALVAMQQRNVELEGQNLKSWSLGEALVPITDSARNLLQIHFECDPGPDFSWWTDDDDLKIANKTALNDEQRLDLICRFVNFYCTVD